MAFSAVIPFNRLAPSEQAVFEKILGRPISGRDLIDVRVYPEAAPPGTAVDRRTSAQAVLDAMDALAEGIRKDVDPAELDAAIMEACDDVRHGRR